MGFPSMLPSLLSFWLVQLMYFNILVILNDFSEATLLGNITITITAAYYFT